MISSNNNNPTLYNFFYKNLKQTFTDLNLRDELVLKYIAALLTHFARMGNLYRIKKINHQKIETVVEMLMALEETRRSKQSFAQNQEVLIQKHIGDFTLFMSGIFREYVEKVGILDYYLFQGHQSYQRLYNYIKSESNEEAEVFNKLSHQFENYSGALDYMKKVYFYYETIDEAIRQTIKDLLSY